MSPTYENQALPEIFRGKNSIAPCFICHSDPEHCGQVTSGCVVAQLSAMETLCCLGKIFYYVGLILYMVCDSLFDWLNFFRLPADKEEFKVDNLLFLFMLRFLFMISCVVGLFISLI